MGLVGREISSEVRLPRCRYGSTRQNRENVSESIGAGGPKSLFESGMESERQGSVRSLPAGLLAAPRLNLDVAVYGRKSSNCCAAARVSQQIGAVFAVTSVEVSVNLRSGLSVWHGHCIIVL